MAEPREHHALILRCLSLVPRLGIQLIRDRQHLVVIAADLVSAADGVSAGGGSNLKLLILDRRLRAAKPSGFSVERPRPFSAAIA
jgi:hypothetical protein